MTNPEEYIVDIRGLTVRYPDGKGGVKTVLNDVNLKVRRGEFVTVVGPSGCGKSTLLRMVLGCEVPTGGTIKVNGVFQDGVNRHRGIVFQKYSVFPQMRVVDNIAFGLESERMNLFERLVLPLVYRVRLKECRTRALEYVEHMGLKMDDAWKYPFQLSGGMQQRVAIAQAMIMRPAVLLMDEPFSALDDPTREKMQLFSLEQWEKEHMTVFFVTHSLEEALFLGTRVIVLSQYYVTDAGPGEGSKIVMDREVPEASSASTDLKYDPVLTALKQEIRETGLNQDCKRHVRDFDLSHPDSIRPVA